MDPPAGHFRGAVLANEGDAASVTDITVTASGLANFCDGGDDRLRGILLQGGAVAIDNNRVSDNGEDGPHGDFGIAAIPGGPAAAGPAGAYLGVLKSAGLLSERREGTRRLYRARPEGLAGLRDFLDEFWSERLDALTREAEREERRRKHDRGSSN